MKARQDLVCKGMYVVALEPGEHHAPTTAELHATLGHTQTSASLATVLPLHKALLGHATHLHHNVSKKKK